MGKSIVLPLACWEERKEGSGVLKQHLLLTIQFAPSRVNLWQGDTAEGTLGAGQAAREASRCADTEGDVDMIDGDMDMDGVGDAGTPMALRTGPSLWTS